MSTPVMRALFAKGMADADQWSGPERHVDLNLGPILRLFQRLERLLGKRLM